MPALAREMARAQREGSRLALLWIDLDRFKAVNDEHGHSVGDEVLVEVSRRLLAEVRATVLAMRAIRAVIPGARLVQTDDAIAKLAKLRELLVEVRHWHRRRIVGDVVDLVVHQHAQRRIAVRAEPEERRTLADRPVEGVLDDLLCLLRGHDVSV